MNRQNLTEVKMTKLSPAPEWLKEAVQPKDTCWSAKEGFKQCDDSEAPWGWSELDKANNADDVALCPGCADAFLVSGGFSNGILVDYSEWESFLYQGSNRLTPFAERPAHSGEYCNGCFAVDWITVFCPELGGWVTFDGDAYPDSDTWTAYADELPPQAIEIAKGFGLEWAEDL